MQGSALPPELTRLLLTDLRSRNEDLRQRAAKALAAHVAEQARELQGDTFTKLRNELNRLIFELVNSVSSIDRLAGVQAIEELINIDYDENLGTKITRLATHLRAAISSTDPAVVTCAAHAIGHLAKANTSSFSLEFVEFEVKRSFEWLQYEPRRYAAVTVLRQLASAVPTLFIVHVSTFFDQIWVALRDPKDHVREAAAEAVGACLQLVAERENGSLSSCYGKTFEEAQAGFKVNTPESVHGSLLIFGEILLHTGALFMRERFQEVCQTVLRFKSHPNRLVRRTVITLLPRLASCYPDQFVQNYLPLCMEYLLETLKKLTDANLINYGSHALIAMGDIALAVGAYINPYLDSIVKKIKSIILKKKDKLYTAAIQCTCMLATAVGFALVPYMAELPKLLFSTGLSPVLMEALGQIARNIPDHRFSVQMQLLDQISLVLVNKPYNVRAWTMRGSSPQMPAQLDARATSATQEKDHAMVALVLRTLHTFDFEGIPSLPEFARYSVSPYLDEDDIGVRTEAALACCRLIRDAPQRGHIVTVVSQVLRKLVSMAISDPDSGVRTTIIGALDPRLDYFLAQTEYLSQLFIIINDETFTMREAAVRLLGRLAERNPANVIPRLRAELIRLKQDLVAPVAEKTREESSLLLMHIISTPYDALVRPYVEPLLKVLLPRLRDPNPRVAANVLRAVGELARVGRDHLLQHMPMLTPLIIETLQDQGSAIKREVALRALSQLTKSSGTVIDPLVEHPLLLDVLLSEVKNEPARHIRRAAMKVLGELGALDPDRVRVSQLTKKAGGAHENEAGEKSHAEKPKVKGENLLQEVTPSSDDYYPVVAFTALLRILRDPSLEALHTRVIEGMILLFRSSGASAVAFLSQLMPPFIALIRAEPDLRGFLFQQMSKLVTILKQHMRDYADQLFAVIREYWSSNCLIEIVNLVQEIAESMRSDFALHLPELLPLVVHSLSADASAGRQHTLKLLSALRTIDSFLQDELHAILPSVVRLVEHGDQPSVQREAVITIRHLTSTLDLSQHAARIVHPLLRAVDATPNADFVRDSIEVLSNLCQRMQADFTHIFHPVVAKVLARHRLTAPQYEAIVQRSLRNERLRDEGGAAYEAAAIAERRNSVLVIPAAGTDVLTIKKLKMNEQNLRKAWEVAQRSTKEDWIEWIRWFAVEQLRESPSPALRSCLAVAQIHHPLAQELFNAAFVSNWTELEEDAKKDLIRTLQTALASPNIPPELLQTLLNLAEFMEHDERPLPLDVQMLSGLAEKCKAYAKALHYKENEFHATPTSEVVESLIAINSHLQEQEAAVGILKHVQQRHGIQLRESWYEKLDRWEDALEAYERRQRDAPNNVEFTLGRMRCLRALGEWERLGALADSVWRSSAPDATRRAVAPLATAAAWNLGQWGRMDEYLSGMRELNVESSFFRAVSCVHREQYADAQRHVEATRDLMANELGALVSESYGRAYTQLVLVQQLAEIEEVIAFRRSDDPDYRARTLRTMKRRLLGCQRDLDVWQRVLSVHSLVMSEEENMDAWLKFASIARRRGRLGICARTLRRLLQLPASGTAADSPLVNSCPRAPLAYIKFLWASGARQTALEQLRALSNKLAPESPVQGKCLLRLGVWQREMLTGELKDSSIRQVLGFLEASTRQNSKSYKAWHAWALFNFEVVGHYERPNPSPASSSPASSSASPSSPSSAPSSPAPSASLPYVVAAVTGFFNSISLGHERGLQDILRVLTLLFNHGAQREVEEALVEGFRRVSVDTWLRVIPQIIARIHIPVESQRRLIHNLLSDLGKAHPQALVYPLTVASKSQSAARIAAAESLMNRMRAHSAPLLDQALLVSQELIRVAILWHELWYEGLEEAYRLFLEQDIEGMFNILSPLHQQLERGAETPNEVYFVQMMGPDLQAAWETCRRYHRSGKVADLNKAWDVYHNIFRRIRHLPALNMLELRQVSPKLLAARSLSLAVPGTYREGGAEVVTIRSFHESLPVISSKQRPRKLLVYGSDGLDYTYLLKGHEDLRQDERVMQLFGLVNTLLGQSDATSRHNLSIQRYALIPLSPNSGLIGWVPQCDTLHALIRDYRNAHRIPLDLERRLMLQIVPDGTDSAYERLMLIQKVEAFEHALATTGGMDMNRILWLKSPNSEMWLFRRNNYTRSLAVMSMVGYVLGLGDRHPNNLMLDRLSGKIMHIDFGDCFEVAMTRDRYSEKVPFRLTRMLVNAMEAGGIEGNFKMTCESVMQVLRDNKDSLMAMLEAFVYDPLINWRLLTNAPTDPKAVKKDKPPQPSAGVAASPVAMLRMPELLNERAVSVIQRVSRKLTGRDFGDTTMDVPAQVQRLIEEASSAEALCQSYMGWCPFW